MHLEWKPTAWNGTVAEAVNIDLSSPGDHHYYIGPTRTRRSQRANKLLYATALY